MGPFTYIDGNKTIHVDEQAVNFTIPTRVHLDLIDESNDWR